MFDLGQVVATQGVLSEIPSSNIYAALRRHSEGDWGEVSEEDRKRNDDAVKNGERIISSYRAFDGTKFWIITEWDRSYTTVLLPEEY